MRRSILSINDNKSMNFLVQTVLSPKYNLLPVTDVYQAMGELKRKDEIELIIIDIDYHTQENLDFIQHIKTSGLYQDTHIIVLTSNEQWKNEQMNTTEVASFFLKPFSPQEMVKNIDELMNQRSVNLIWPQTYLILSKCRLQHTQLK